jgi:antitoxin component YwqK of YwqJK toxin-antitoxin module
MPSIIMNNGDKYWHIYGIPSRLDMSLPYIEKSDGYKEYNLENDGYKKISPLKEEWFNKDNEYHRENGPVYISYYENGKIKYERYFLNGNLHRENGPANISYYANGNIKF